MKRKILAGLILSSFSTLAASQMVPAPQSPLQQPPLEKRADVSVRVKEHFAMLDANKDGAVTQPELQAMHEARRAHMMDQRFGQLDSDKDGKVSKEEFGAGQKKRKDRKAAKASTPGAESMRGMPGPGRRHGGGIGIAVMQADENKDGKVTEAEMEKAALARFDAMDANKDGMVSREERRASWRGPGFRQPEANYHNGKDGYDRAGALNPNGQNVPPAEPAG